jgi:hypothetical protein
MRLLKNPETGFDATEGYSIAESRQQQPELPVIVRIKRSRTKKEKAAVADRTPRPD